MATPLAHESMKKMPSSCWRIFRWTNSLVADMLSEIFAGTSAPALEAIAVSSIAAGTKHRRSHGSQSEAGITCLLSIFTGRS